MLQPAAATHSQGCLVALCSLTACLRPPSGLGEGESRLEEPATPRVHHRRGQGSGSPGEGGKPRVHRTKRGPPPNAVAQALPGSLRLPGQKDPPPPGVCQEGGAQ